MSIATGADAAGVSYVSGCSSTAVEVATAGVSCAQGEVEASVFDRYRDALYKEASFKPYIIAAMIFLAKVKDPAAALKALEDRATTRRAYL